MSKEPRTNADMKNVYYDYTWGEVGQERNGPIKGIREKLLTWDKETGSYTRIVHFEPGFKFDRALNHPFWEELLILEGHMIDYGTDTLYEKGAYGLRPPGMDHGPFGTDIGCTLLETTWYDEEWYKKNLKKK